MEPHKQSLEKGQLNNTINPKFLFPKEFSISAVSSVLRKKIDMDKEESLIIYVEHNGKHILLKQTD